MVADYDTGMLREAYDQLDWQMVEVHDNLSVPSASPAYFEYGDPPGVTDAEEIKRRFEDSELACIDVLAENGAAWYEFSYSAKVFDDAANEFCNLSISTPGLSIFRRQNPLSYETFKKVVRTIEGVLNTTLVYEGSEDDE